MLGLLAIWAKLLCAWLALMHKLANKLNSANNMRCLWALLTIFPFLSRRFNTYAERS